VGHPRSGGVGDKSYVRYTAPHGDVGHRLISPGSMIFSTVPGIVILGFTGMVSSPRMGSHFYVTLCVVLLTIQGNSPEPPDGRSLLMPHFKPRLGVRSVS
jgi:hypothetical protein